MGYARGADSYGVDIIQNCEVGSILRDGGRIVSLETSRGTIAAKKVGFAVAGNTSRLWTMAGLGRLPIEFNLANLAVVSAVTLVAYLALQHLSRSPWGRVLKALREDERAAISLGKSARFYRVQAFAVGGALMGLAGAVQAHFIGFIAPECRLRRAELRQERSRRHRSRTRP